MSTGERLIGVLVMLQGHFVLTLTQVQISQLVVCLSDTAVVGSGRIEAQRSFEIGKGLITLTPSEQTLSFLKGRIGGLLLGRSDQERAWSLRSRRRNRQGQRTNAQKNITKPCSPQSHLL